MSNRRKCEIDQQLDQSFLEHGHYKDPTVKSSMFIMLGFFCLHLSFIISAIIINSDSFIFEWFVTMGIVGCIMFGLFFFVFFYTKFIAPRKWKHAMQSPEYRAHIKKSIKHVRKWKEKPLYKHILGWTLFVFVTHVFIIIPSLWWSRSTYLDRNDGGNLFTDIYFIVSASLFFGTIILIAIWWTIRNMRIDTKIRKIDTDPNAKTATARVVFVEELSQSTAGTSTNHINNRRFRRGNTRMMQEPILDNVIHQRTKSRIELEPIQTTKRRNPDLPKTISSIWVTPRDGNALQIDQEVTIKYCKHKPKWCLITKVTPPKHRSTTDTEQTNFEYTETESYQTPD